MVDNVKYLNKEETLVLVMPEGWVVHLPCETWHQNKIEQWKEGRTDDWDIHKRQYDTYQDIMQYEENIALYDQCSKDNPETLLNVCISPIKPFGYYTQEEVNNSTALQLQWVLDRAIWEADPSNMNASIPRKEPVILKRPNDLPVVVLPPNVVPNTIEPYVYPIESIRSDKLSEFKREFIKEAYSPVNSLNYTWSGGVESAMLINGKAQLLEFNNVTEGTIHTIHHVKKTFTIGQIKLVAATISAQYEEIFVKYQEKKVAIATCGEDAACILNIEWDQ